MIVFPPEFVPTRYPGYFWNTAEKKLYSIKVTGELRPLKFDKGGCFFGKNIQPGYRVSVKGERRKMTMAYLGALAANVNHTIEVEK